MGIVYTDVSIDMSPAFIKGVEDNLPNAAITFDKYHIMKIINTAVDDVRKAETREQDLLRGQKYLFLKNRQNLTESQRTFLASSESMPRLNLKTVRAYHIRENFQENTKKRSGKVSSGPSRNGISGQPIVVLNRSKKRPKP